MIISIKPDFSHTLSFGLTVLSREADQEFVGALKLGRPVHALVVKPADYLTQPSQGVEAVVEGESSLSPC